MRPAGENEGIINLNCWLVFWKAAWIGRLNRPH
jgi:hypothetical protein